MFASIDWGEVLITTALFIGAVALFISRMKPDARAFLSGRLRQGKADAEAAPAPKHAHASAAHDDDHSSDGHHDTDGPPRPIVAVIVILIAVGIIAAGFFMDWRSPSPGTVSEVIRNRWLTFLGAILLLNIGATYAGEKWQIKRVAFWASLFIVGIGLFGPWFDGPKAQDGTRMATAGRTVLAKPSRPANAPGSWTVFTAPAGDTIDWIINAGGHTLSICDPVQSPNCEYVDPATLRYRKWCKIGSDVFAWETGKCVVADAIGVQSTTGAPLTLVYMDIPNGEVTTPTEVAQAPVAPDEPEPEQASVPEPEPALQPPQSRTIEHSFVQYEEVS